MFPNSPFAGLFLPLAAALTILPAEGGWANPRPLPRPQASTVAATLPAQAATMTATAAVPASGGPAKALKSISGAEIDNATYSGGDLPPGQSALTAKVQVLLDRSGISPGVVDGWRGGMSESAIMAFQRRAGLPMTGRMDMTLWNLLQGYSADPITTTYTITEKDEQGLVDRIPSDYAEKAAMSSQGYTSVLERLAERFHMDEKFLAKLNEDLAFVPGVTISVTRPAKPIRATVTRIIVDKQTRRVAAYDAQGNMVADYPATVGSSDTPSPHGLHLVTAVALDPTYTYNPKRNFKQGDNDRVLIVPPGPNGPVGNVWIDLSEPTYGLHGTATPSRLFVNQSHGCVRLTNWDAWELAHMVKAKVTTVEFLAPGVSIADATGAIAQPAGNVAPISIISGSRPPMRSSDMASRAAKSASSFLEAAAATTALTIVAPPKKAPQPQAEEIRQAKEAEALSAALARAEALADEMLAQRAEDVAASVALPGNSTLAADNPVTGKPLPPPQPAAPNL
ncbi:L,D-transpeptidase [Paracoccus sp. MBLB3053]|uniref:L,D-transpeptidase n=1 Tax=Paracoccus aurantius TaxID=3073814 RepID=A0ABU2HMP0_9RHOB|nr:L,D-transpeptidase [Paracoccus sp. MBLB3053]MDS9466308.1 L,D-transpeptidase [Paracoccus sp. MBLB3053]